MATRVDAHASRLLIDEPLIPVSRTLASTLGLEEATILQQLHFRAVSGVTDRRGRWSVQEYGGHSWVSWSPEGMLEDVPLGESLSPHRRALANLRSLGVVVVQQLDKARWNRANYYRIDHPVLSALLDSRVGSTAAVRQHEERVCVDREAGFEDVECPGPNGLIDPVSTTLGIEEEQDNPESAGEGRAGAVSLVDPNHHLRRRLSEMIGQRPNDNQVWDRKRLASILAMVSGEGLCIADVERVLDDPEVRYLSQVEKRVRNLLQERQAAHRVESAREDADRRERLAARRASESFAQDELALELLARMEDHALASLSASVIARVPVPSMKESAKAAIFTRRLGTGMVRALILAELEPQLRDARQLAEVAPAPSPAVSAVSVAEATR